MPWHLSKSDPRKVYDERHEVVCVCQTAEQAARIVAAVTGESKEVIRLREQASAIAEMARVSASGSRITGFDVPVAAPVAAPVAPEPEKSSTHAWTINANTGKHEFVAAAIEAGGATVPLDSFEPDTCCGPAISKAARSGVLRSVTSWECPKCGMEWQPAQVGSIRHWSPTPAVMIFRR